MIDRGLGRLAMVITSQWGAAQMEQERLDFLPPANWEPGQDLAPSARLPVQLYEQFLDPEAGACDPVPGLADLDSITLYRGEGELYDTDSALIVNPTLPQATAALAHGFQQAQDLQRVLVVHYIGHGMNARITGRSSTSHRLLLMDSARAPATSSEAWNPYQEVAELIGARRIPGFVFLVDACHAASARPEIGRWGDASETYVWFGASQDTEAFNGCFSRTLLHVMEEGDSARTGLFPVPDLHSTHLRPLVDQRCNDPKGGTIQRSDDRSSRVDDYVFVTKNRAVKTYEADLGLSGSTATRLRTAVGDHYQTIDVEPIVEARAKDPFVVVTGGAGAGKTALAAVLRDPPPDLLDAGIRRVDAVAFLDTNTTLETIAEAVEPQLRQDRQWTDLIGRYERSLPEPGKVAKFERCLAGPASLLEQQDSYTLCLDGLDQLGLAKEAVLASMDHLLESSDGRLQVLATSRPRSAGGPIPDNAHVVEMPPLTPELARRYLVRKGIEDRLRQDVLLELGSELNWLVLTLAASQELTNPDARLTGNETDLYETLRARAERDLGAASLQPVTDTLVAAGQVAGVGPRLPFEIFRQAVHELDGPDDLVNLNLVLSHRSLYPIIERSNPATDDEHVGLFHLTAINALEPGPDRMTAAHLAITTVLDHYLPTDDDNDSS